MKKSVFYVVLSAVVVLLITGNVFAQRWNVTTAWEGKTTVTVVPNASSRSLSPVVTNWLLDGSNTEARGMAGSGSVTAKSEGKVTFTYTWEPQTSGQPAPPDVYIVPTGTVHASASRQFIDNPQQAPGQNNSFSATTSSDVPGTVVTRDPVTPPQYPYGQTEISKSSGDIYQKISVSGGFSKTYNLSGTATGNFHQNSGLMWVTVSPSCSLRIHPTPYDWHHTNTDVVQRNGTLKFVYTYYSTSGKVADLSHAYFYEIVNYPGGNPYVAPLPFVTKWQNPTKTPVVEADRVMTRGTFTDVHSVTSFQKPFSTQTFTAKQKYYYDDKMTGENQILMPSTTGENDNDIKREITYRLSPSDLWYSVSKSGFTSWLQLPSSR